MKKYLVIMGNKEDSEEMEKLYVAEGRLAQRIRYPEESNVSLNEMNKQIIRECDIIVTSSDSMRNGDINDLVDYGIRCCKTVIIDGKTFKNREETEYVQERDWDEFQKTGLVLYINQILHAFGYAITFEREDEKDGNKIIKVYPARTKFRGFSDGAIDNAYANLAEYMKNNAEDLYKDVIE